MEKKKKNLHAFTVEGRGSIPGWGTKIQQVAWHHQNKPQNKHM